MSPAEIHSLIVWIWIIFIVVWLIGAFNVKRTQRTERRLPLIMRVLFAVLVYFLMFTHNFSVGFLRWRFVRPSMEASYIGLVLTAMGAALAIWARVYIGRNWSAIVMVKENHELVQSGPYAFVRHPIYTGILLASLGTVIELGQMRGIVGLALVAIGIHFKSKAEERLMTEQFGARYEEYSQRTRALIPFVL